MDSTSFAVPQFCFYSETHGAWSYGAPSYIHMCPLATILTDTRLVVENTMEPEPLYFTNSAMDRHWMDSEFMPPIAHYQHYPCEEQLVADENVLTTEQNFDGITSKNAPNSQIPKKSRIQKNPKSVKKEQVETPQETEQIVDSIMQASESEADVDPDTKRKMKRAERERNRYHSMTLEARQAMRKRRYAAKKQRQAEKN